MFIRVSWFLFLFTIIFCFQDFVKDIVKIENRICFHYFHYFLHKILKIENTKNENRK